MDDERNTFPSFKSAPILKPKVTPREVVLPTEHHKSNDGRKTLVPKMEAFYIQRAGDEQFLQREGSLRASEIPSYTLSFVNTLGDNYNDVESLGKSTATKEEARIHGQPVKYLPSGTDVEEGIYLKPFIEFDKGDSQPTLSIDLLRRDEQKLNKSLSSNPKDINAWITLARLQENIAKVGKIPSRSMVERQLAILQRGIRNCPESVKLLEFYFELQGEISSPIEMLALWDLVLSKFKQDYSIRWAHIEFYLHHCFTTFSVQRALDFYMDLAHDVANGTIRDIQVGLTLYKILRHVFFLLASSGHRLTAIKLFYSTFIHTKVQLSQWDHHWDSLEISSTKPRQLSLTESDTLLNWYMSEVNCVFPEQTGLSEVVFDHRYIDIFRQASKFISTEHQLSILWAFLDLNGVSFGSNDPFLDDPPLAASWTAPREFLPYCPTTDLWRRTLVDGTMQLTPNMYFVPTCPLDLVRTVILDYKKSTSSSSHMLTIRLAQLTGEDGLLYMQEVLQSDPSDWNLWINYSCMLRWLGQDQKAERTLAKILKSGLVVPIEARLEVATCLCEILICTGRLQECPAIIMISLDLPQEVGGLMAEKVRV